MIVHAGVVGDPIAHSLSPALHRAAYQELGLTQWRYDRHRVPAGELSGFVSGLDSRWVGLSVTMPGKEEALALAGSAGADATLVGAANTLIRRETGWHAENTDVSGLVTALREIGADTRVREGPVDLLGSGATARAGVVALHRLGVRQVRCVVRDRVRDATIRLAAELQMSLHQTSVEQWACGTNPLVINTLPGDIELAVDALTVPEGAVVFDVGYAPWPTALATLAMRAGARVHGGALLLLHQAADQVMAMTGRPAPVPTMRAALAGLIPPGG